jgi:hypothetical protein
MTGFLEQDDSEKGRPKYFKSPLISEPVAKINWSELIESTKEFMKERWPEVADEYISRFCGKIDIIDPITGKELSLDTKDKKAKRILPEGSVFSTKDDEELWKGGDGKVRMGRIPGKLKRRMWIKEGDLLIVEPWVVQSKEKCDIKYRYTKAQRIRLNLKNRIPVILQGLNI